MVAENARKALRFSNEDEDGLSISDKWYIECINEISELERFAKIGKAVIEAFDNGYTLDAFEYDEMDELKLFNSIKNEKDLIKWLEGVE